MRIRYVVLTVFITIILAYTLGCFAPLEILSVETHKDSVSEAEYLRIIISIIATALTLCAVLVALFKDDIRELYNRPNLEFLTPVKHTVETTITNSGGVPEATNYTTRIIIRNKGNVAALNVEVFLETLKFKDANNGLGKNLEVPGTPIGWIGITDKKITLSPGSQKMITIAEIIAPNTISTPDGTSALTEIDLNIGKFAKCNESKSGIYEAKFSVHSSNYRVQYIDIDIKWNGEWKTRLQDFETVYQIDLKD